MELRKTVFTCSPASASNGRSTLRDARGDGGVRFLRWIPAGTPGKTRLGRRLMKRRSSGFPFAIRDNLGFLYDAPDISEPIAFHLAVDGVYEPETLALILRQ